MATEFELQVLQELSDIKKGGAANAATLTALNHRLFDDPTGLLTTMQVAMAKHADIPARVTAMEDDMKDHKKWQNIKLLVAMVLQAVGAMVGIHYKGHP